MHEEVVGVLDDPVEFVDEGGVRPEACEDFEQAPEQGRSGV